MIVHWKKKKCYQFLKKLLGFGAFNGDRGKKHKKSGTRACNVSMKCQGMQSDNIMKCDESQQWHVKPVQFKARGLPKTLGKAWFQLVICRGPSTLKKKKKFINKMLSLWENLPVTYITSGKEQFVLQFYKWSRPPYRLHFNREASKYKRTPLFLSFSAFI